MASVAGMIDQKSAFNQRAEVRPTQIPSCQPVTSLPCFLIPCCNYILAIQRRLIKSDHTAQKAEIGKHM